MTTRSVLQGAWLCIAIACNTNAAEWSVPASIGADSPFDLDRVLADGNGYVLVESHGTRWLRVADNGDLRIDAPARPWPTTDTGSPRQIDALGDDRFVIDVPIRADADGRCRLAVVDGGGDVQVVGEYPSIAGSVGSRLCAGIGRFGNSDPSSLDGAGGLWLESPNSDVWLRMQRDGVVVPTARPADALSSYMFSPLPDVAESYALYSALPGLKLARLGIDRVAWTLAPFEEAVGSIQLLTAANGDALLGGRRARLIIVRGALVLARYGRDGGLRWQRTFEDIRVDEVSARVIAGDRLVVATHGNSEGPGALYGFSGDGELQWSLPLAAGERFMGFVPGPSGDPRQAPANTAYFVGSLSGDSPGPAVQALELIDAGGQRIVRLPATDESVGRTAMLQDGSLIHATGTNGDVHLMHVGTNGVARPTPDLRLASMTSAQQVASHVANDGASFALHLGIGGIAGGGSAFVLSELRADGSQRWRRQLRTELRIPTLFSGSTPYGEASRRIQSNPVSVCVGPVTVRAGQLSALAATFDVQCFRRSDGSPMPEQPQLSGFSDYRLLDDGRIVHIELTGASDTPTYTLVGADGQVLSRRPIATPIRGQIRQLSFDAGGDAQLLVMRDADGGVDIVRVDLAGTERLVPLADTSLGNPLAVERLADGGAVLQSQQGAQVLLSGFDAAGSRRWQRSRPQGSGTMLPVYPPLLFSVGAGHVLWAGQAEQEGGMRVAVEVLDAISGASHWRHEQTLLDHRGISTLAIDATRRLALLTYDRPGATVLVTHALDSGDVLGKRPLRCAGNAICQPKALQVVADDSLRLFDGPADVSRIDITQALAAAPVGQPAMLGTWFSPGTTGQGLFVDYSAQTGDLLAGWFSYSGADDYRIGAQRWFTLSGEAAPGSEVAEFSIDYNEGGRFDSLPVTVSQSVGTATLRLHSCTEAVLSYRFDSGEHAGLHGDIDLLRLTPALFDCEDRDGGLQSATGAVTSADGSLDIGQSGAWFSPATSGQGLLIDLRPPSDGDDGLLVGGWFTYDPAGAADDPTAQHWFLLEGTLAGAQGGVVTVPVYRAIGGRFDQRPTSNVQRVGEATLTFDGCSDATLAYRFDDSDIAGDFAGREGSMPLIKLLPCHR